MSNLDYVSVETRRFVNMLLDSRSVHFFTQEIIERGLGKDCVDVVSDVQLALEALTKVQNDILKRGSQT